MVITRATCEASKVSLLTPHGGQTTMHLLNPTPCIYHVSINILDRAFVYVHSVYSVYSVYRSFLMGPMVDESVHIVLNGIPNKVFIIIIIIVL